MRAHFEATAFSKGFVRGNGFLNNGVNMANSLIKNPSGLKRGTRLNRPISCAKEMGRFTPAFIFFDSLV